jgi:hypothetical protein
MALKTNLSSLTPSVERLKTAISLPSRGYSLRPELPDGLLTVYPWDSEVSAWFLELARTGGKQDTDFSAQVVRKLTRLSEPLMQRFLVSELLLVMLVARSLTSGGQINYQASCPHCGVAQKPSSLKVPDQLGTIGAKPVDYPGYDVVTLPECKDEVSISPLTVADALAATALRGITATGAGQAATIVAVGGGQRDSVKEVVQYYLALSPTDRAWLNEQIEQLSPGLDTRVPHACDACSTPFKFNLALHYDFFR